MPKIVFFLEGVNGCGKTTVNRKLQEILPCIGIDSFHTKQSRVDFNKIYGVETLRESPEIAQQLYMADRLIQFKDWADTYREKPNAFIICDRGPLSSYAYGRPSSHHAGLRSDLMVQNTAALRLLTGFEFHQIIFLLPTGQAQNRVKFRRNEDPISDLEQFEMTSANNFYTNLQTFNDQPHGPYSFINAAVPLQQVVDKVRRIIESRMENSFCHERYPSTL